MHPTAIALCALVVSAVPLAAASAQQPAAARDCDAGAARRQLTGQPMTDFLKACRAGPLNPENLGKICTSGAQSAKLSGSARDSYMQECMKGPD